MKVGKLKSTLKVKHHCGTKIQERIIEFGDGDDITVFFCSKCEEEIEDIYQNNRKEKTRKRRGSDEWT